MKKFQNVISALFLFCSVAVVPGQGQGSSNSNDDNEMFIWSETDLMNPDEMNPGGDILPDPPTLMGNTRRWPNGNIPYVIEGHYTSEELQTIKEAMVEIQSQTCVGFIPHTSEPDYVVIESKDRCRSHVGRVGGRQTINLQRPGCLSLIGTVFHELLHTIGFVHEHSRPDRDDHISVFFENIQDGQKHDFIKYTTQDEKDFGISYDYESVMHGSQYSGSKNKEITLKSKDTTIWNTQLGQRARLSTKDIMKINDMYECVANYETSGRGRARREEHETYRVLRMAYENTTYRYGPGGRYEEG